MKIIRFRRLDHPCPVIDGVRVERWEIAFSEADLWVKLDGAMAEIDMLAQPFWVRWWRWIYPMTFTTNGGNDEGLSS